MIWVSCFPPFVDSGDCKSYQSVFVNNVPVFPELPLFHQGSNDVGWNDPTVSSPELDALAAEGIILESMYTVRHVEPFC